MSDINVVLLTGNLTKDPELKYTPSGMAVCDYTIAVNGYKKDKAEGEKDPVSFVDCVSFNKQAEAISQYQKKGSMLTVSGKIKQERWEKDGQKHSRIKIMVSRVKFSQKSKDTKVADKSDSAIPF